MTRSTAEDKRVEELLELASGHLDRIAAATCDAPTHVVADLLPKARILVYGLGRLAEQVEQATASA